MDEMWADFAKKVRSGEVSAAAGSGGGLGGLLGSGRGAASWAHLLMMIAMIITLWIRRKERARKKAERLEQVPAPSSCPRQSSLAEAVPKRKRWG